MNDELKPVDLREHPEADLSANAEKGAAAGGAAGVVVGAIAGSFLGPGGAALGAIIGGVAGAVGTGVVIAASDTQGEHYSDKIQNEADAAIARNELRDEGAVEELRDLVSPEEEEVDSESEPDAKPQTMS